MFFKLMPGLEQLTHYNRSNLRSDMVAGTIVAFLLIPQSMAYAIIAGVPLSIGLFAGTFPLIIYALFGGSKFLSIGPVSIVSLLAFAGISNIAQPDTPHFFALMILLTLIVGIVQLVMGFIKFGSFFEYLSPAIISGFTSAAAIIIALNQVKSIIGISIEGYQKFFSYAFKIIQHMPGGNLYTIGIGVTSIVMLLIMKKKFLIGPLLIVTASIIVVSLLNLDQKGVEIVGKIPQEVLTFSLHIPTFESLLLLFPIAFMIGFISFVESYAIAKTLAQKENEQLDPNQELLGLGLANITSSIVGAIPVAGAISRTAVNHQSGAKSNLSLLITAFFMLLTILYLTPLFYYLPKATLAAIIIIAVLKLINLKQIPYYFKNKPSDALIFLATFTSTLIIDIFIGLITGIVLSLIIKLLQNRLFVAV